MRVCVLYMQSILETIFSAAYYSLPRCPKQFFESQLFGDLGIWSSSHSTCVNWSRDNGNIVTVVELFLQPTSDLQVIQLPFP